MLGPDAKTYALVLLSILLSQFFLKRANGEPASAFGASTILAPLCTRCLSSFIHFELDGFPAIQKQQLMIGLEVVCSRTILPPFFGHASFLSTLSLFFLLHLILELSSNRLFLLFSLVVFHLSGFFGGRDGPWFPR